MIDITFFQQSITGKGFTVFRRGIIRVLLLVGVAVSLGANPASVAVEKVREGIRYFVSGEFESADKSFTEADRAEPDNATIAFDRACALAASSDSEKVEEARKFFRDAALARDVGLAGRAHYNLGTLSAEQGRATLGENPVEAAPEKREEGESQLLAAVGHYRDCLKLDNEHADARHNLELIRLFIKHIQDQWVKRDREKAREEKGLLEFLAMIEQRQTGMRSTVQILSEEDDSPQRRQAASELSDSQMKLREEIEPLKDKIAEELAAAQQASAGNGAAQDPNRVSQIEQAQTLLQKIADEAGSKMESAATDIAAATFEVAREKQLESLDRLNEIYMAVAPFTAVLQRATRQQERLIGTSETLTGYDSGGDEEVLADGTDFEPSGEKGAESGEREKEEAESLAEIDLPDDQYPELALQQSRVTDWSRMLSLKAQAELPQIETQLQAAQGEANAGDGQTTPAPSEDDDKKNDDEDAAEADAKAAEKDALAQLEGMKASLEKAIELGPKVEEHSRSAADGLQAAELARALPDQQEALKLLREIAEPLKKDDQQQGDDQQNQDQQNDDGDQGDQNQQNDQQQDKSDQQKQQEQQQQGQSQRERAMSALRRAREREREHRDLQKQLQQLIGGRIRVDRDW